MSPRQRVVVTSGIGSGKSTVIHALSELGWSVINADEVGHEVLLEPKVTEAVRARWPAVLVDGEVIRSALAKVAFGDPTELSALEAITHPLIVNRIDRWFAGAAEPAAVEVSVPKLTKPEWGTLVLVHSPLALRRERALRRGMTADDVEARMSMQPSDDDLLAAAGIVIDNQGTMGDLMAAVQRFDQWARSR